MIRVAMITRATLFTAKGGDTVQVLETAKHLAAIGVTADIKLTDEAIDYNRYDLIHFFNITRPADILYHLKKSKKPFVVSPILIDYSEYDKHYRKGIAGVLFRWLPADSIEYLKTLARWLRGNDALMSFSYILKGHRRAVKKILKETSILLPNSKLEYERISNQYKYAGNYIIVPNGIDPVLFHFDETIKKDGRLVICVARIEGIKNQINLIKALNKTKFNLLIIGAPAPNQLGYYQKCKKIAANNINFIEHVSQHELLKYYQQAKVHVLPSWFETTGLSSLEAAVMGCNVVITNKGDAKEYFEETGFYCDPGLPESIYAAVEKASLQEYNEALRKKIFTDYTWQQAALQTKIAYKDVKTHHATKNSHTGNKRDTQ
ncbi:MAG: glycosyltransferase family 4 protein [Chitinophagaceae bacterium]|nr:glycosyltransferase family 4 protein [Chitinophagaceae bacterium]